MKTALLFLGLSLIPFSNKSFSNANPSSNESTLKISHTTDDLSAIKNLTKPKSMFFASSIVTAGQIFTAGSLVAVSVNGLYYVQYQSDGNLVLCNNFGTAYWASGPLVSNPSYATFSANGSIYLQRNYGSTNYWNANNVAFSAAPYPSFYWILQNDGNFVRYDTAYGSPIGPSTPCVSTGTGGPVVSSHFNTIQ